MISLLEFYNTVISSVPLEQRYTPVSEYEDVVLVNLDSVYRRECGIYGTDQLIYAIHQQGTGKRFIFVSEDGAIVEYSGAIEVIKNVIDCFNLTADTCCLICRETITIENCQVITCPAVPYWCNLLYPTLKNIPIAHPPFDKKFAAWFHRGTFYRLELAKYLTEKHSKKSYISYQESGVLVERPLRKLFAEQVQWAQDHTPIVYDELFPNRVYDHEMIVGAGRKPYDHYFIEIVAETDILTTSWITEKTIKNLFIGKPFIVYGGPGLLKELHSYGFKTFSPWIDESYDTIKNAHQRLEAIKHEIDRLAKLSVVQSIEMFNDLLPTLSHNRKHYETFVSGR